MQADRYLDIRSGILMIVTDLHGDGAAFNRYVETFLALRDMGEADRLIILGDLIHGYGKEADDASLSMVLRLMELQKSIGDDKIILLLGNHEMPHIYGVSLAKGNQEFTPRFERMLGSHRETVIEFFKRLPFVVRTTAGVLFCHAGPDDASITRAGRLRSFDHDALLQEADRNLAAQPDLNKVYETYAQISGESYENLAKKYLAVDGPNDPRYPHLMRALFISERDHRFAALWDFLFTQNERGVPLPVYEQLCQRYLDAFGAGAATQQRVCVSGHIQVPQGGYHVVNDRHFRLASAAHASPREAGAYLLMDSQKPISTARDLVQLARRIF